MQEKQHQLFINLLARRIEQLAAKLYKEIRSIHGSENWAPFGFLGARARKLYLRLAAFVIQHNLHPFLYLRVMREFQINMYPTNLYGHIALQKYNDYMAKLRKRYRTLKAYTSNISDPSINILRNDLYMIAGICDPAISPEDFWRDMRLPGKRPRLIGLDSLKQKLGVIKPVIDKKTFTLVSDLLASRSISTSSYSQLIKVAVYVKR